MSGIRNGSIKTSYRKNEASPYVNPFVHKLELEDPIDIIKTYVLTVILLPFRVICICTFLTIAWLLTCLGLYGLSPEDLKTKPLTGWRKKLKKIISTIGIGTYLAGGIAIVVNGRQAMRKEAPILVVAPHSSFLDSCIVYVTNLSSIIVRKESMDNYAGKLINFSQPIYVLREDPNSRQNTIKEIVDRANSKDDWPQIVIFPEGTCTNRSALITFKPGAFYPGVPIQPVLLRYPNKLDSFTWTWEGPGALKLLWLTLTQVHCACEIEFLPVYNPSSEEKANPKLYAKNVRDVMARALGVPVSDFTYDDCIIMTTAKDMRIPHAADIVEIERLRKLLKLQGGHNEEEILSAYSGVEEFLTIRDFAQKLRQSPEDDLTRQLFNVLDEKNSGKISLRDYLLCAIFLIKQDDPIIDFILCAAKIYNVLKKNISREEFYSILRHTGRISKEESELIYLKIASINGNCVKFDDFIKFIHQTPEYSYLLSSEEKLKKH